jgi:(p)ppGpp synthase/HD superfamily hydrolase
MRPGKRFRDALTYAARLHAGQLRKGTSIPYVSHLLAVAAIAIEHGADEDEAIAALLHDTVEDQGGRRRLLEIRRKFGGNVAAIVEGCTDAIAPKGKPKPEWRSRKQAYISHLADASPSVLLVSAADKLHNAQSILAELETRGPICFEKFNGKRDGTLWYYRALVSAFSAHGTSPLVAALGRTVSALENLASRGEASIHYIVKGAN